MAYSPDGKTLATAGKDGTIRLRTAASRGGTKLQAGGPVRALAFAPDGKTLAVACDGVQFWDVAAAKRTVTFPPHTEKVPRRTMTTTVVDGKTVPKFEPVPGEFVERRATVHALAFAPRRQVDRRGRERPLRGDGPEPHPPRSRDRPRARRLPAGLVPLAVVFSPDGSLLVTASAVDVRISDAATGRERAILKFSQVVEPVRALALSPDGKTLAVTIGREVRLWDVPALLDGAKGEAKSPEGTR